MPTSCPPSVANSRPLLAPNRMQKIIQQLAAELRVQVNQVQSAVELLDGGATVPFIARYRKEATGNLDDIHLRELEQRLGYLRELEQRREAVIRPRPGPCCPVFSRGANPRQKIPGAAAHIELASSSSYSGRLAMRGLVLWQ